MGQSGKSFTTLKIETLFILSIPNDNDFIPAIMNSKTDSKHSYN